MLKKINNPFNIDSEYLCYGCSSNNKNGLMMEFFEEDDKIISFWNPQNHLQGWKNILHGGIQSTLMDEIASWAVFTKIKSSGVTSKMNIKFLKPAYISNGQLKITASIIENKGKLATIKTEILNINNELISEAEIEYFIYPENIAKQKLGYPGIEEFYK